MATLNNEVRAFIVQGLVQSKTPSEMAYLVKKTLCYRWLVKPKTKPYPTLRKGHKLPIA